MAVKKDSEIYETCFAKLVRPVICNKEQVELATKMRKISEQEPLSDHVLKRQFQEYSRANPDVLPDRIVVAEIVRNDQKILELQFYPVPNGETMT